MASLYGLCVLVVQSWPHVPFCSLVCADDALYWLAHLVVCFSLHRMCTLRIPIMALSALLWPQLALCVVAHNLRLVWHELLRQFARGPAGLGIAFAPNGVLIMAYWLCHVRQRRFAYCFMTHAKRLCHPKWQK